ncbi:MAG: MBL fold metallo-hydrolase [Hyalangium sp.]|uniref:MBL fold metallo-hydrolase n=1 Tax=Hyalangium sp. TaxID=2028555 RepID=UPI00389AF25A
MFRLTVSMFVLCLLSACGRAAAPALRAAPAAPAPIALSAAGEEQGADIAVTRIAHASVLLEMGGKRILTDPWFSETNAYRHGEPLGIALENLPKLDLVIASHDHYDHFDIETFAAYSDKAVPMVVAPEMAEKARTAGFTNVQELKPWQSVQVGDLTVTACPGAHSVEEVTYMLQSHGSTVYFGGDSRLIPEMDELPKRFPSVQLALLPVNGLHAMGKQVVMNADEAAQLAGKLHAEVAVPIHYRFQGNWFTDTFILRYEGSPERFTEAAKTAAPSTQVRVLAPGERLVMTRGAAAQASGSAQ